MGTGGDLHAVCPSVVDDGHEILVQKTTSGLFDMRNDMNVVTHLFVFSGGVSQHEY